MGERVDVEDVDNGRKAIHDGGRTFSFPVEGKLSLESLDGVMYCHSTVADDAALRYHFCLLNTSLYRTNYPQWFGII